MTLKRKILALIVLLTLLLIIAISGIYFELFNRQIREQSQAQVMTAFELIVDDLTTRSHNVLNQIDRFVLSSLTGPMYMTQLLQEQHSGGGQTWTINELRRILPHLSSITNETYKFATLIEASEILVYDANQQLRVLYERSKDANSSGIYLPTLADDKFIPIDLENDWTASLRNLEDIPVRDFPPDIPLRYQSPFPQTASVVLDTRSQQLTLTFLVPVMQKTQIGGLCVVRLSISQDDVERYSRVSHTKVNIFAGEVFSVGTLPESRTLPDVLPDVRYPLDLLNTPERLPVAFAEKAVNEDSYYQGVLLLGDEQRVLGAVTANLPRQAEKRTRRTLLLFGLGIIGVFALVATGGASLLSAIIVRPLMMLITLFRRIAQGDLTVDIAIAGRDEIARVLETLQDMLQKLKGALVTVKSATVDVTERSLTLKDTAKKLAEESSRQAISAEEASSSIEEVSANIKQNADNALQTEKIARQAAMAAQESGKAVLEAVAAMQEIAQKITLIEDIAQQTRMLSLNATIEAAHSQEHGRGFSVVASEVRALAERSQSAVTEINELVGSSVKVAEKAGGLLTTLVPDIQKTAELVQEISAASHEQSSGVGQITIAVQQLEQMIQENVSISEQLFATSETLSGQAQQLQQAIEFFVL